MYELYKSGRSTLMQIIIRAAAILANGFVEGKQGVMLDRDQAEGQIIFELINKECNQEFLADKPYREFLDLAVIYRIVLHADEERVSIVVTNAIAERGLKMTEGELWDAAYKNTKELFPITVKSMIDNIPMYVITNRMYIGGAAAMLYEEVFHDLSEKLATDLVIMPSSIHEVIVVPSLDNIDMGVYLSMVEEVNEADVCTEERLSNAVYYYSAQERRIEIAKISEIGINR